MTLRNFDRRGLLLAVGGLGLTACQSNPLGGQASIEGPRLVGDYQLGSGDKVRITVFGEPELSGEFVVSGAGLISMPLAGDIAAQGRTITQVQRSVEEGLRARYLLNPQVSAEVLGYRPFYMLGEVNAPGTYPYAVGLTVLNAVATAGGFTYRADTRRVFVRAAGGERELAYGLTTTTQVAPGDTIRIGERLF